MTRPSWETLRPWLGTVARLVLGIIWIWASLSKIAHPRTFVQAVRVYDATPEWLSKGIGYGLPILEFALGLLLIIGIAVRVAAAVSGVLFVIFLIGLVQAAIRGIQLECGCFGNGGYTDTGTTYTLDILRDVGLLILAAYLVVWSLTRWSLEEFIGRHDYVPPPSAKRMRSEQGRRKYYAALAKVQKDARSRDRWISASLSAVVVLVALIGIGVQSGRAKIDNVQAGLNASVAHGIVFGKEAAATVDVYEDFQCPVCLDFESQVKKTMDADVRANRAQVRFHTIAFLDEASSGNRYSTRAANAAYCISDIDPGGVDLFVAFHNLLFTKGIQPPEGGHGMSNTRLEKLATQAGLPTEQRTTFIGCVENQRYVPLVEAITDRSSKDGVTGTPTVFVNGKPIEHTLAAYKAAVAQALKHGPKPHPSVTPSPTPSESTPATSSGSAPASGSPSPTKPASSSKKPSASKSAKRSG